ncbi:MAG: hypothetical protein ACRDD8_01695, partial [Bacteroidales bacterium]
LKKLAMWKFGKDFLNTNFYKNNSKFIKIKKMAIKYYYSIAICLQPEVTLIYKVTFLKLILLF